MRAESTAALSARVQRNHASATPLLHDFLARAAERRPDKVALVGRDTRLTYAEIETRTNALAHALLRRGLERGDRVVIFTENSVETVLAFWATLKANGVVSVVNPLTRSEKLAYLLNDCRARVLVADWRLASEFVPAAGQTKHLRTTILVGGIDDADSGELPGRVSFSAALGEGEPDTPPTRHTIDIDLGSIIYTSGSTGDPKGVMLTHRNMITAATSVSTYLELESDHVILCGLPLAFDYGLYQPIMATRVGARVVLERSFAFPAQMLTRMIEEKVSVFPGVSTTFGVLAGLDLSSFDLSSVSTVTNTAAALQPHHIKALRRIFPMARIYSMYGLTECQRCTYLPPEDLEKKPLSVGVAIPNTELWLVDGDDRKLGPNQVGQLVIRGATVMKGYWEKPEETAKMLRPGPHPGEQVLYTGDYCKTDEDGYLYFVARMDDIINSRGEKVSPVEVERAIYQVAGVREVAVIGVPDELLGEAVKAVIVPDDGAQLSQRDIQLECHKRLESFMVPKYVEIASELPKGQTGKIQRAHLKEGGSSTS